MKKTNLLTIVFILFSFLTYGQNNIEWGDFIKSKKNYTPPIIIDGDVYKVFKDGLVKFDELKIVKYSFDSNKDTAVTFKARYNGEKMIYVKTIMYQNRWWLFTRYIELSKKIETLIAQEIDIKTMKPIGKQFKCGMAKYKNYRGGIFNIYTSKDKSVLLTTCAYDTGNKEDITINFSIFKDGMKKDQSFVQSFPFKQLNFKIEDIKLNNEGSIYVLGRNSALKWRDQTSDVELIYVDRKGHKVIDLSLDKTKDATDLNINFLENDVLIAGGYYSEDKKRQGPYGTVIYKINTDHNIFYKKTAPLIKNNINDKQTTQKTKLRENHLSNLKADKIEKIGEDHYLIIGEKVRQTNREANSGEAILEYSTILVTLLNTKGEIEWVRLVRKHTEGPDGYRRSYKYVFDHTSYFSLIDGSNLYLLFYSNVKNVDPIHTAKIVKKDKFSSRGLFATKINLKGEDKTKLIAKAEDLKSKVKPKLCYTYNDKSALIFGHEGMKIIFGILNFDKLLN